MKKTQYLLVTIGLLSTTTALAQKKDDIVTLVCTKKPTAEILVLDFKNKLFIFQRSPHHDDLGEPVAASGKMECRGYLDSSGLRHVDCDIAKAAVSTKRQSEGSTPQTDSTATISFTVTSENDLNEDHLAIEMTFNRLRLGRFTTWGFDCSRFAGTSKSGVRTEIKNIIQAQH